LEKRGKNPFDAFDYPDAAYAAQNETRLPPCKNGAASCKPWERDWTNTLLPPGAIVTDQGIIIPPTSAFPIGSLTVAQWVQVVSVFLSALLAMIVGILLDLFKRHRDSVKATREKLEHEVQQINGIISGIGFNISTLSHIVMQNILPHYNHSHAAYKALHNVNGDGERIKQFAISLHQYPALIMTCPQMHFREWDFWTELPLSYRQRPELTYRIRLVAQLCA
jgi:hypothetical protein